MKAILCERFGPPESLVLEETSAPAIQPGQLRIRIGYCSVNFPDALMIQGQHQYKFEPPFIPGGEISGVVTEVGEGVRGYAAGDTVAALCYRGGFAEEAVVPAEQVCKLAAGVDMAQACCLVGTYGTALHALEQRAALRAGETLLVLGAAGGSGAAAVQIGKLCGARVIAAVGSDAKSSFARSCGADETVNYASAPLKESLRLLSGARGVDVVYDPVGGEHAETALRATAWNGRYLVVGFASGAIPAFKTNLALLKGCAIVGVFTGEFVKREPLQAQANIGRLLQWMLDGRLRPAVSRIVPLIEMPAALRAMLNREVMGKIVVEVNRHCHPG